MAKAEPDGEIICSLRYGEAEGEVRWLPDKKVVLEHIELEDDLSLVRGSKCYYIAEATDRKELKSRLENIGTLADYLKGIYSFELSVLYINSPTEAMKPVTDSGLKKQERALKRKVRNKEAELRRLLEQKDAGIPTGGREKVVERELNGLKKDLEGAQKQLEALEEALTAYKEKAEAATFLVRLQAPIKVCCNDDIKDVESQILKDLRQSDRVIKDRMKTNRLNIQELPFPSLAFSTETLGVFDPRELEDLANEHDCPALLKLKEEAERLFVHRWTENTHIGGKTYEARRDVIEGIAKLLMPVAVAQLAEPLVPQPDPGKLPQFGPGGEVEGVAFTGFVLGDGFQLTGEPYLFNFHRQGPRHTIIVGGTGSGKTITAYSIVEGALLQGIPVLVLDPTDQSQWTGLSQPCKDKKLLQHYEDFHMEDIHPRAFPTRVYTPGSEKGLAFEANLLACPDVEDPNQLFDYVWEVAELITMLRDLNNTEKLAVEEVIEETWNKGKSLDSTSLIQIFDKLSNEKKATKQLARKIKGLARYAFLFKKGAFVDVPNLWKPGEATVLALRDLGDAQRLACQYYLLRELVGYFYKQPDSAQLELLVVLEEAHRFLPRFSGVSKNITLFIERVSRELRKSGVGLLMISQVLTDFPPNIRANVATKVWMYTGSNQDIQRAADEVGSERANLIPELKTGHALVHFADFGPGFFVGFRPPLSKN